AALEVKHTARGTTADLVAQRRHLGEQGAAGEGIADARKLVLEALERPAHRHHQLRVGGGLGEGARERRPAAAGEVARAPSGPVDTPTRLSTLLRHLAEGATNPREQRL